MMRNGTEIPDTTTKDHRTGATDLSDPVCGMRIEKPEDALRLEHHGRIFYFCSPKCRD